jgi:oxygen-dependent protoporphyrinogen oxidase
MQQLVDAIAAQLPPNTVRFGAAVEKILQHDNLWRLEFSSGEVAEHDAVIVAAPAPRAARMLHTLDEPLAAELAGIPYAGAAIALLGYRLEQLGRPPRSFGFVVPEVENRKILAASFSSLKFPGRAPEGRVLIRVFLGGAKHPELIELDDVAIKQIVTRELGELLAIRGEPELFRVERWRGAMPQYHVGHLSRLERIQTALKSHPTLALAGNAYRGVGIPQCIASGMKAAQRVLRQFPAARRPRG